MSNKPRKALFLQRNLKIFNKKNLVISPNTTTSGSISTTNNNQTDKKNTDPSGSTKTILTSTVTTSKSTTVTTTITTTPSTNKLTGSPTGTAVNSVPGNGSNNVEEFWRDMKSGSSERLHSDQNKDFYGDDQQQIKLNPSTFKMVYVINKDHIFYKKNSLRRAKQVSFLIT